MIKGIKVLIMLSILATVLLDENKLRVLEDNNSKGPEGNPNSNELLLLTYQEYSLQILLKEVKGKIEALSEKIKLPEVKSIENATSSSSNFLTEKKNGDGRDLDNYCWTLGKFCDNRFGMTCCYPLVCTTPAGAGFCWVN